MKISAFSKILFLCFITFIGAGCNFNATYKNREADKQDAEKITSKLYSYIDSGKYNQTHELFSEKFLAVTDTAKLNQIFTTTYEKLGKIKDRKLQRWETVVVKGTTPISEYLLIYDVSREKYKSIETIRMLKEKDIIKIISYNVNSDGFFVK